MLELYENPVVEAIMRKAERDISYIIGSPVVLIVKKRAPSENDDMVLPERELLMGTIMTVCGVTWDEVKSKSRKREIVLARQLYCFFARKHLHTTYKVIGEDIGGRDHTTAIHGARTMEDLISVGSPDVRDSYLAIKKATLPHEA